MRLYLATLVAVLFLISLLPNAEAGISLGQGGITLPSGSKTNFCDVWIYATQEGGTYHIGTTGDVSTLTTKISPNDFTLTPIDCPQETNLRRSCISEKCMSPDNPSCKVVCLEISAPIIYQINPEKVVYNGAILNSIKIGVATIKEPYEFSVQVEPIGILPVIFSAAVLIIVALAVAIFVLKKRNKKKSGK